MRPAFIRPACVLAFVGVAAGVAFWISSGRGERSSFVFAAPGPLGEPAPVSPAVTPSVPLRRQPPERAPSADPVADLRRAWRTGTAGERERATRELLPGILAGQPSAVASLLDWPEGGLAREHLLQEIARSWAQVDLPAAAAWLLTLPESDAAIAGEALVTEVGRDDAPGALTLAHALRRGVDDGRVEHVAQLWTEENPAAAVTWIAGLAAGPDRDRLLGRIALVRVRHDPAEATRLLAAMTDGAARDAALTATIARLRIYDPARADSWQAILARN